jgi:hypothetical protein
MKILKFILVLFISASITSCSDNESNEPSFLLSNDNLAGTYEIKSFSAKAKVTSVVSGLPITVNSSSTGDSFQVDFIIDADGSYTVSGLYRVVTMLTTIGSKPVTNIEILQVDDSGTYEIDSINGSITFTSSKGDLLKGTLNIVTFNETTFNLTQEVEETEGETTAAINANFSFIRK